MDKNNSSRMFTLVSWGVTLLIVLVSAGFAYWRITNPATASAAPVEMFPTAVPTLVAGEPVDTLLSLPSIERQLTLKTIIPERPRYAVVQHTVQRGDSIYRISKEFSIKPETLLWANYDALEDDPHSLKPGQELFIPPTDGILYKWKDGDTIDKIAGTYEAKAEDIVVFPGNDLDLTNPNPKTGQWVMIPGGWRESKAITLPTVSRGRGTGTAGVGGSACGAGGAVGSGGFIWPADNHSLSGNDYFRGHLGIDIADGEAAQSMPLTAAWLPWLPAAGTAATAT